MGHEEVPIAFFSYCREDSGFALQLAADLKGAGAHVWIDQLDIEPGTPWDRAVEDALTNSPRMLVVLSPVSVNSDNVRDEVSFALSRQKRVIPVLYRDCEVPFRLARLQHIDFRPDYAKALSVLLRALGVGQAAHEQGSPGAVAAAAVEIAVPTVHQEQQTSEAEERAGHEQSRREQRAAEQARLEEEARLAAERVRLAQVEKKRREAEIKARQEQLRREEQESVERKSLNLDAEPQAKREPAFKEFHPGKTSPSRPPEQLHAAVEARQGAAAAHAAPSRATSPSERIPPTQTRPPASRNLASLKYLVGALLVAVLGLVIFMLAHRSGPQKPPDNIAANKSGEAAPVHPAPVENQPSQSAGAAGSVPKQDQATQNTNPAATDDLAKAKNLARPQSDLSNLNPSAEKTQLNVSNAANSSAKINAASAPNRVRVSQGVSHGMLMYEVAPAYPPLARSARVQGPVVLDVVIGKDGAVQSITAKSGHPMLVPAAIDAVKKWRYKPYKLDGKPVEFDTQVMVDFTLTN